MVIQSILNIKDKKASLAQADGIYSFYGDENVGFCWYVLVKIY